MINIKFSLKKRKINFLCKVYTNDVVSNKISVFKTDFDDNSNLVSY